jgi:opacity protein-like surface antigen
MTKLSGTMLAGERRSEGRGARTAPRRMEISLALALLAATSAVAQNAQPAPQDVQPPPPAAPQPPPPPQYVPAQAPPTAAPAQAAPPQQQVQPQPVQPGPTVPQSPPPPRYETQPQYQPVQPSPPPPQYPAQEHPRPTPAIRPDWVHTESDYPEAVNGFHYHPFRFHIDAGGTITQQANDANLDNGWNAGLGFSWFPTSVLPLGIRIDGTYNHFDIRTPLLQQAATTYGTRVDEGTEKMWGGDADLELDLNFSPYVRLYLLAGGGWYRTQDTYRQINYANAVFCDWWGCGPGYIGTRSIVARNTTNWRFAKNAGLGFEFALAPRTSFFVEARYMRLNPNNAKDDFLPIRAGLRF